MSSETAEKRSSQEALSSVAPPIFRPAPFPAGARPARSGIFKLLKEDGAWWMALTAWICGWAASLKLAWEPLIVAPAVVSMLAVAQSLRASRRLRIHDRCAAQRALALVPVLLIVPIGLLVWLCARIPDYGRIAGLAAPAVLYAPFLLLGEERHPIARVLAVAAITAIAPVTYALALGAIGIKAWALWASLGGYFLLGTLLVIARLRRTAASPLALGFVRLFAPAGAAAMIFWGAGHWILAAPFLILAGRAWGFRVAPTPIDPRRIGRRELVFSFVAAILILLGIWLR